MSRRIYEVQRDLARSSGWGAEIIWDSLAPEQSDILKEKIQTLLPADDKKSNIRNLQKARNDLFQNVWLQRKYTNRILLSTIIYVMVTEETDFESAKQSTTFSCHPVVRTRKCMNSNNSAGCCMVFIDENARVYQNWKQYLQNNVLPKGTMIAPANGIYTLNANDEVELEMHPTPAKKTSLLSATDKVAGVGALVATAPLAASVLMPVAAPVMLAATAVTLTTAAYSTVRSALHLTDRYKHCQSTALTNREARNSWLGVAGGVVGLGATGATRALTYASSGGKNITLAAKMAVGGINVSSILVSGTDIVNSIYDVYLKCNDEELRGMDLLQLASSLVVFTHSINNLALVSKMSTRNGSTIRRALRTQIRKTYSKISCEGLNMGGQLGKLDFIRIVNNIPTKENLIQYINTCLGASGVGGAGILGSNAVNAAINMLPQLIGTNAESDAMNVMQMVSIYGVKLVRYVLNADSFLDVIEAMAKYLCERGFHLLLNLTRTFLEESVDAINTTLHSFIPTEKVLYEMFMFCVKKYSNLTYEYLENKQIEILTEIENYFYSINPINDANKSYRCKHCKGYYYESTL